MEKEKYLGKISSVRFGIGGYNDAMIGLFVCFSFDNSGICADISAWDSCRIEHTDHCEWTEDDRSEQYNVIMRKVSKLLSEAKVNDVYELKGIPVEVELKGNTLSHWRILTEVL